MSEWDIIRSLGEVLVIGLYVAGMVWGWRVLHKAPLDLAKCLLVLFWPFIMLMEWLGRAKS